MYDEKKRFTKRHWLAALFLMVILGIIAVWQGITQDSNQGQEIPAGMTEVYPEFGLMFNADGNLGVLMSGTYSGIIEGTYVSGMSVNYIFANGEAVYQGDILLPRPGLTQAGLGIAPRDKYLWPDVVPYEIADNLPDQYRIHDAIAHWEAKSDIRFVERTSSNAAQYPNFIRFVVSSGCASYVGMQGGMQAIYLAKNCSTGNTIHEIAHALGLWHEQSRNDRDQYVEIHYENIYRGYEHNFDIRSSDGEDIGEYDYGSIMHYPRWAFSRNGDDTIVPRKDGVEIGQRETLSEGDLAAIHTMYDFKAAGR
jgi:hypothetical protein